MSNVVRESGFFVCASARSNRFETDENLISDMLTNNPTA